MKIGKITAIIAVRKGSERVKNKNIKPDVRFEKTPKENRSPNDLYDLDKWHLFEKENPNIFFGMYQFSGLFPVFLGT